MAEDAPLRYDADRGIIWSVGDNGLDNGGDFGETCSRFNWDTPTSSFR